MYKIVCLVIEEKFYKDPINFELLDYFLYTTILNKYEGYTKFDKINLCSQEQFYLLCFRNVDYLDLMIAYHELNDLGIYCMIQGYKDEALFGTHHFDKYFSLDSIDIEDFTKHLQKITKITKESIESLTFTYFEGFD